MGEEFVDYYELMQISPNAEHAAIVRVFRMLAARCHPDNPVTGDPQLFRRLVEGYKILTDAAQRAEYDQQLHRFRAQPRPVFAQKEFVFGFESEANRRLGVLALLYTKRRTDPDRPGTSMLDLEQAMAMPREHLAFALWYLKDKGLLEQNETSDFMITHQGVDFVEVQMPKSEILNRLLKAPEGNPHEAEQNGSRGSSTDSSDGLQL